MHTFHRDRLEQLQELTAASGVDGILLSKPSSVAWACGFFSSVPYLYITPRTTTLIASSLYAQEAQALGLPLALALNQPILDVVARTVGSASSIGYQSNHLTVAVQ